jgi:ankyrin repeat protein
MIACRAGHGRISEILIEDGADIFVITSKGYTVLRSAADAGLNSIIDYLVNKGLGVNGSTSSGSTPLIRASGRGHADTVELLISLGANVHAMTDRKKTAFNKAASSGHIEVMDVLLRHGAEITDPHARGTGGSSILYNAAEKGALNIVKNLVLKGANIETGHYKTGTTPLMAASLNGHKEVADLLISSGANIQARIRNGETALFKASKGGHSDIVEILLDNGADISERDIADSTPLIHAAKAGHDAVVRLLVDRGSGINEKNRDGETAFEWAFRNGKKRLADYLISKGATYKKSAGFYDSFSGEGIIRSVWLDLDKALSQPAYYELNIGHVYKRVSRLISISKLSDLSGMDIYIKGPHLKDRLNLHIHSSFGHYNKEFVVWMKDNLIPGADDKRFRSVTRSLYNKYLRDLALHLYRLYVKMQKYPDEIRKAREMYLEAMAKGKAFSYISNGIRWDNFWLRRSLDGTDREFFRGLEKLLITYDKAIIKNLKK